MLSAIIANTPSIAYFDSLGRPFLSVQHNRTFKVDEVAKKATVITDEKIKTITQTDIEGNLRSVTDARENVVMQYKYDMLGHQVYSLSMDAGKRWMLNDTIGKPIHSWDMRYHYSTAYDQLHRPLLSKVEGNDGTTILNHVIARMEYGETAPGALQKNLRGKPYQVYDASGLMMTEGADFKGNILIL